jgi:hypothetical protein
MLVLVEVFLFLVVLEHLHLRIVGFGHERGPRLVGERHCVVIGIDVVPGVIRR